MSTDALQPMLAELVPEPAAETPVPLEDRWKTRWVWIGLLLFALLHATSYLNLRGLEVLPPWLLMFLTGVLPQLIFFVYPFLTRERQGRTAWKAPSFSQFLVEFAIAVPTVFATLLFVGALNYVIGLIWPGKSATPDVIKNMGMSPGNAYIYFMLITMFTLPPLGEETFFRWFLYGAFRARMPLVAACLIESLIFGFGHTFGAIHGAVASVLGIVLTLLYQWRKTLLTPMLVHCGINFIASLTVLALMTLTANSPMLGFMPESAGGPIVVHSVLPDSAAEEAKLQPGDIIRSVDHTDTPDLNQLFEVLRKHKPGDRVEIKIERDGETIVLTAELKKRPS